LHLASLTRAIRVCQASMQGLSNMSMSYLNYPAKVLFKSSRVLPTMLFGVLCCGKRHSRREYMSVFLLVLGLLLFMVEDASSSPSFDPTGVLLIVAALIVDAGIINFQEHLFEKYQADEEEMIFMSYAGGTVILLLITLSSGEVAAGVEYLQAHRSYSVASSGAVICIFTACGFCGVSCVAALTKRFSAVTAVLTTTTRKALTLILSFVFFPKPFSFGHFVGISFFVLGIVLRSGAASPLKPGPVLALLPSSPPAMIPTGDGQESASGARDVEEAK